MKKGKSCTLEILEALEREVVEQLVSATKGETAAAATVSAMLGSGGDDADKAEAVIREARTNPVNRMRSVRLTKIREAIIREKEGAYGVCTDCGEAISAKRLKSHPEADKCVACQEKKEQEDKKRVHHGSRIAAHV